MHKWWEFLSPKMCSSGWGCRNVRPQRLHRQGKRCTEPIPLLSRGQLHLEGVLLMRKGSHTATSMLAEEKFRQRTSINLLDAACFLVTASDTTRAFVLRLPRFWKRFGDGKLSRNYVFLGFFTHSCVFLSSWIVFPLLWGHRVNIPESLCSPQQQHLGF